MTGGLFTSSPGKAWLGPVGSDPRDTSAFIEVGEATLSGDLVPDETPLRSLTGASASLTFKLTKVNTRNIARAFGVPLRYLRPRHPHIPNGRAYHRRYRARQRRR